MRFSQGFGHALTQPRPQDLLRIQNGGVGRGGTKQSKNCRVICHVTYDEMVLSVAEGRLLCFLAIWNRSSTDTKYFIMFFATKYSTILVVSMPAKPWLKQRRSLGEVGADSRRSWNLRARVNCVEPPLRLSAYHNAPRAFLIVLVQSQSNKQTEI